jgi:hypothetical protein
MREKALLSPIQRMPIELVTEIISYVLASGMDKQQIASVCKSWKSIVLNTGRFWREIKIDNSSTTPASLQRLKRALELSGSGTLVVSLYWYSSDEDSRYHLLEHIRAVTDAGIYRWQSLHLWGGFIPNDQPNPIADILKGNFSSLRSLTISRGYPRPNEQNIFEPIYRLIAETCPGLHHFSFSPGEIPESLIRPSIYRNLTSIEASAVNIAKVRPKFDVPNLYIKYPNYRRGVESFEMFELPHTTTFNQITMTHLSKCGLDRVEVLTVRKILPNRNEDSKAVRFPNLRTLEICVTESDHLLWLFFSEAPKLSHLKVYNFGIPNLRLTNDFVEQVFKAGKHRIGISPTHLDIRVPLTVGMTLRILKHWPQIQDLTLYWDEKINLNGMLLTGLCNTDRRENGGKALCPDLQVLRIVVWDDFSQQLIDDWLKVARRILKARKKVLPLWKITLTSRDEVPLSHSITTFDIK